MIDFPSLSSHKIPAQSLMIYFVSVPNMQPKHLFFALPLDDWPVEFQKATESLIFTYMNQTQLWIWLLLLIPMSVSAQTPPPKVYQFSGLVISKSSDNAIPFVRIQVNHTRQGAVSNSEGFYSVPVGLGDTLYFSHIGFHPSKMVVMDYLQEYQGNRSQYIYAINYMLEDSLTLDTVNIFPYDTPEELRTAVVNMEIPTGTPDDFARQNLDPKTLHLLMATLPVDGSERLQVARNMYFDNYQTRNLLPTVGFDPIAATRLLQYIAQKAKRKKNKNLNYWDD